MFTITQGVSAMAANPMPSCIREKPGPDVAVMDLVPTMEAPMMEEMLAISSSICMKVPPTWGNLRDRTSAISEEGLMG